MAPMGIGLLGVMVNMFLLGFLNNRGELGADGKEIIPAAGDKGGEKLLTQAQVDAVVQDRLARERSKFSDYDDLRKFKTEFEKSQDAKQLQLLEEQKKYEEAKTTYTKQITERDAIIQQKDAAVNDMKISGALMGEIMKQNAYPDETMALMKQQAVFDKEGNIRIKGRDANGLEVQHSVEEGIKQFLTSRPHLVKVTQKNGAGTGAGNTGASGAGTVGDGDLTSLNDQLSAAQARGDQKEARLLAVKVKAAIGATGARY
jgi:hypothetical protein